MARVIIPCVIAWLASVPSGEARGIEQVEHIVIFMQENRAYGECHCRCSAFVSRWGWVGRSRGLKGDWLPPSFLFSVPPSPTRRGLEGKSVGSTTFNFESLPYSHPPPNPISLSPRVDHYYGTLDGVRGFNDRTQTVLPSGLPALFQPSNQKAPAKDYILPFPAWTLNTSSICMDAPTMEYYVDLEMYNGGRVDAWNTARAAGMGMSYMTRADLPYYYALYDAFTAGDQYFQSTFTCTNPNRMVRGKQ